MTKDRSNDKSKGAWKHPKDGNGSSDDNPIDAANKLIGDAMKGVGDALSSIDYTPLQDTFAQLGAGVGSAMESLGRGIGSASKAFMGSLLNPEPTYEKYLAPVPAPIGGMTAAGIGWFMAFVNGAATLLAFSTAFASYSFGTAIATIIILAAITAGFAKLALRGTQKVILASDYNKCRSVLLRKPVLSVRDLAAKSGVNPKRLPAQLQQFIDRGWTPEGHLSQDGSTFLLTNELYVQYQEDLASQRAEQRTTLTQQQSATLDEIHASIERISAATVPLNGQAREEFEQTRLLATQIEAEAKRHPEVISQLGMFSGYYLPTTAKLVESYAEIASKSHPAEKERAAAQQILESLVQVNDAFHKLLDSLAEARTLDIESDLAAMQSMLRQDGLSE